MQKLHADGHTYDTNAQYVYVGREEHVAQQAAQLYLTGQNLFTLTGYSGFDPDVNSMGGDARFGGIDIGAYPRTRTWNLGLSITF